MRSRLLKHERQGPGRGADETFHVERKRGLVIVEFQRGHERKVCVRLGRLQA